MRAEREDKAKAYDLRGLCYRELADRTARSFVGQPGAHARGGAVRSYCEKAIRSHLLAVINAGLGWPRQGENTASIERRERLLCNCLRNLAAVFDSKAEHAPDPQADLWRCLGILRSAAELAPDDPDVQCDRGRALLLLRLAAAPSGRPELAMEARHAFDAAVRIDPNRPEFRGYRAASLIGPTHVNAHNAAWDFFADTVEDASNECLEEMIAYFRRLDRFGTALAPKLAAVRAILTCSNFKAIAARAQSSKTTTADAVAEVKRLKALRRAAANAGPWEQGHLSAAIGYWLHFRKKWRGAAHQLDEAIKRLEAKYPGAVARSGLRGTRALALAQSDDDRRGASRNLPLAIAEARRARDTNPLAARSYHNLGGVYYFARDTAQAKAAFDTELFLEPNSPVHLLNQAESIYRQALSAAKAEDRAAGLQRSLDVLTAALGYTAPEAVRFQAKTHFWIAHIRRARNDFNDAVEHFRVAFELRFLPTRSRFELAVAYRDAGEIGEAIRQFDAVLAADRAPTTVDEKVENDSGPGDEAIYVEEIPILAHAQICCAQLDRSDAWQYAEQQFWYANERLARMRIPVPARSRCVAACALAEGRLRMAQGRFSDAISMLVYSTSVRSDAETYVWLAKAYQRMLLAPSTSADTKPLLTAKALDCCEAVSRFDPAQRYKLWVADTLKRLTPVPTAAAPKQKPE